MIEQDRDDILFDKVFRYGFWIIGLVIVINFIRVFSAQL